MYTSLIKQMPEISKYLSLVGTCHWFSCDAVCVQFSLSVEVSALHHETYSHILFHKKEKKHYKERLCTITKNT